MSRREDRAKLFKHGGSQAVRLPKQFRFEDQSEVFIRREGERVVLEPVRRVWSARFLKLGASVSDFPYPDEPLTADRGPDLD